MSLDLGFGQNLEGFLIKGNLSLVTTDYPLYQGNGSIEASGNLYIDYIEEYTNNVGVNINSSRFYKNSVYIPFTAPSTSSNASLLIDGGITINNTTNAINVSSGGGLTIKGGASISKDVYIGGITNTNLNKIINLGDPDPMQGKDAVNVDFLKDYVNNVIQNISGGGGTLVGNFTSGQIIIGGPDGTVTGNDTFTYSTTGIGTADITIGQGTQLIIGNTENATGIGSGGALTIDGGVSIAKDVYIGGTLSVSGNRITNVAMPVEPYDAVNKAYVDWKLSQCCCDKGDGYEYFFKLNNNVTIPENIENFTFDADILAFVSYVYVNTYQGYRSLYTIRGLHHQNEWISNISFIGDDIDNMITFNCNTDSEENCYVQYINKYTEGENTIRFRTTSQITSNTAGNCGCAGETEQSITLIHNTIVPTNVELSIFNYPIETTTNFDETFYVSMENINKYALYYIQGVYTSTGWEINVNFIGDPLDIDFYITSNGVLQFTNTDPINDAVIRYINNPFVGKPLPVNRGGTGKSELLPYAILRGNAKDSIIATDDLLFRDQKLELSNTSSILLKNSTDAVNLTVGGALVSYGGVSINRNLIVGTELTVNEIDITPNKGDIIADTKFTTGNNIISPQDITGFDLSDPIIKSFVGYACITVEFTNDQHNSLYEIRALHTNTGWIVDSKSILGDNILFEFSITSSGKIQYTCQDYGIDWVSTVVKVHGKTTTYP